MNNPYNFTGPLRDSTMFFGRTHELREIWTFLSHNQSVSIVGPDRIGKTSLVLHLMRPLTMETLGIAPQNLFVYIDCQALFDCPQNEIIAFICTETAAALQDLGLESEQALEAAILEQTWYCFEAALRRMHQRGLCLVIILDEFEHLTANTHLDVSLYNALRSIASRLGVVYLTCSEKPLNELTNFYGSNENLSSPFFNIFAQQSIGLLSESEASELIRKPMEATGLIVSDALIEFIYHFVGGHPFALQVACFHAWENPGDLSTIESHTRQELDGHFKNCWDSLSQSEREVLEHPDEAALHMGNHPSLPAILEKLSRNCLLVSIDGSYRYPSKAWAEFISYQN
jgi:hypothetical protein